jgi:hypothetical protein
MGKLIVRDDKAPCIDRFRAMQLLNVRSDNHRGKALTETRSEIQCAGRAIPEERHTVKNIFKFFQSLFEKGKRLSSILFLNKRVDSIAMPFRNLGEKVPVIGTPRLRKVSTLEQMIRHTLEGRHHDDNVVPLCCGHHNCRNTANALGVSD